MSIRKKGGKTINSAELAYLLNVDVPTVKRWVNDGLIRSRRVGPWGDRVFLYEDIAKFFEENRVNRAKECDFY